MLMDLPIEETVALKKTRTRRRVAPRPWTWRAGRRLELESLAGTAVRLGKELGVPTPLNEVVYAALKPYVNGHPSFQKKYKNRRSCLVVHLGMRFTYARSTPVTLL